jgi:diadenylate cyclase
MSDWLYLFQRFTWMSVLDVSLVALVFFVLLYLVRGTQAVPLLRGMIVLALFITLTGYILHLPALSWLVQRAIPALLISIPIIFQPELRRALERLGRTGAWLGYVPHERVVIEKAIIETVRACERLAERRHGALIVLERETGLQDYVDTGLTMDSIVSSELLQTIFFPKTVLHDGAAIVRGDRIVAAACILPLTSQFLTDRHMGLRHRAAIGITEATDAIAIVVSEERGSISIAHNGRMIRRLSAARLETVLRAFYQAQLQRNWLSWLIQPADAAAKDAATKDVKG